MHCGKGAGKGDGRTWDRAAPGELRGGGEHHSPHSVLAISLEADSMRPQLVPLQRPGPCPLQQAAAIAEPARFRAGRGGVCWLKRFQRDGGDIRVSGEWVLGTRVQGVLERGGGVVCCEGPVRSSPEACY